MATCAVEVRGAEEDVRLVDEVGVAIAVLLVDLEILGAVVPLSLGLEFDVEAAAAVLVDRAFCEFGRC